MRLGIAAAIGLLLSSPVSASTCIASYYGSESGHRTASGERFDPAGFTAASRSYHFGDVLRVTAGHRSVTVRVNDRGPFVRGRCIDLSFGAARALGILQRGTAPVSIQRLR